MKINIYVPTHDNVPAMFAFDLGQLMAYTTHAMPEDTEIGLTFATGTYVHCARQEMMALALENKDDYVLWLDSDMRFPRETFNHLLQHDVTMVGANYSKRSLPPEPVAMKQVRGDSESPELLQQTVLAENPVPEGLTEVEAVGFGVLLMRMKEFHRLPPLAEGPWFDQHYNAKHDDWTGEDVSFCNLIRKKLGIKIYVDQDLSRVVGHIGQFNYTLASIPSKLKLEV